MRSLLTKQSLFTVALMLVGGFVVAVGTQLMFGAELRNRPAYESPDGSRGDDGVDNASRGGNGLEPVDGEPDTARPADEDGSRDRRRDRNLAVAAGGAAEASSAGLLPAQGALPEGPVRRAGGARSGDTPAATGGSTGPTTGTKTDTDTKTTPGSNAAPAPSPTPATFSSVAPSTTSGSTKGGSTKPGSSKPGGGGGGTVEPDRSIEIKGSVSGLWPGHRKTLSLKLENPNAYALKIISFRIAVGSAGECPPGSLRFGAYPVGAVIGARGEASVGIDVWLDRNVGNECAGTTFPLTYTLRAEKA